MGWDPTITPIQGLIPRQYKVEVNGEFYTTTGILYSHGADSLLSRGGRVFKVIDKDGSVCALKDLWLEDTRKPERQIYNELLDDIEMVFSKKERDRAANLLMTPVRDWQIKIDNQPDMTKSHTLLLDKGVDLNNWKPLVVGTPRPSDPRLNSRMFSNEAEAIQRHEPKAIRHRQHYRVVFKELATPMDEVANLGDVCTVMADIIQGQP